MSMAPTYLLATRNPGKLRELRGLFESAGFSVIDLNEAGIAETAEEDGLEQFDSFAENALAKARHFHRVSGGIPTIADDSGLEVHALGGRPGVRSKRWSGRGDLSGRALDEANNAELLKAMRGESDRRARYSCAAALVDDEREVVGVGETAGSMLEEPRGRHGFGYDPFFLSDELHQTFGEATTDEKARISHRARAFAALLHALTSTRPADSAIGSDA